MEVTREVFLDACRVWMVPPQVANTLLEVRETDAVTFVRSRGTKSVVFAGPVGGGKTIAASEPLLHHFTEKHWTAPSGDRGVSLLRRKALWVSMSEMASLSLWDKEDQRMKDRATETELLVLDDLGREPGDGAYLLENILNSRMSDLKQTTMTTNLRPEAFAERYGARIMDRMRADGAIFQVGGPSLR